ncbi:MAG: amidohydrolase family protein [Calditrichaeota bacterium]|nr:amidohydrolase family protein [Calditrichota bacterium]
MFPLLVFILSALFLTFSVIPKPSDNKNRLVILNARVWTGAPEKPFAQAIAIENTTIIAVGSNAEIQPFVDENTRIIDAEGKMIAPGFIDSHLHLLEGGCRLASVQLRDANSKKVFVERVAEFAKTLPSGVWITGGDWDHSLWGGQLPAAEWIDSVTRHNPVWLSRLDGHMALANSKAMEIAGICAATEDVSGGTIARDSQGNPTGIFKDNAMTLIEKFVAEPSEKMKNRALQNAQAYLAQNGVTSVHHMGTWEDVHVFQHALKRDLLTTRIYAAVPISSFKKLHQFIQKNGAGNPWLKSGGLKGFADGSLGSHTAAFFEPFLDAPDNNGLLLNSPDSLYHWISQADKLGLQPIVHAIGDRANHILLDIYERVISENGERDRRFRIEHAQHLRSEDIPRFGKLGIIASTQPYHLIDDGRWAEKVIGHERAKTTHALKSLLDSGTKLTFGSDWYVAPPNPIMGIYAAVTRRTLDGKHSDGWIAEQKISVEQALRAYTINAAYASFDEKIKGSLEPGKLADLVILDQDIFAIPPEQIRNVQVVMTIVGGKIVFQK